MSGTYRPILVFVIRVALSLIWFYNGLWLKVVLLDPHHLDIVRSVVNPSHGDPVLVLRLIGSCETLLGIGILSGLFHRFVSYFQIAVIVLMNIVGITCGGGTIAHPIGLVISNLPTLLCAFIVAKDGPGAYSLRLPRRQR